MTGRLKQRVTAIMRYSVQHGIISHNPTNDLTGAIATREATHRPALSLTRIPELLNNAGRAAYQIGAKAFPVSIYSFQ